MEHAKHKHAKLKQPHKSHLLCGQVTVAAESPSLFQLKLLQTVPCMQMKQGPDTTNKAGPT